MKTIVHFFALVVLASVLLAGRAAGEPITPTCDQTRPLVRSDGTASIALIVGVSDYATTAKVPDLQGAKLDAQRVSNLLTAADGYGFPAANVCLLLDGEATSGNFVRAIETFVTARTTDKDLVVIYFAGHGSQTLDEGPDDEPDQYDETLIFHDGVELIDDRFAQLLAALSQRTDRITVILDSCNSGTASRGPDGSHVARYVEPDKTRPKLASTTAAADGGHAFGSEDAEKIVFLAAADDGTSAFEGAGGGDFTGALLSVLGAINATPLTYAQAGRQVASKLTKQRPAYYGPTERVVFENRSRTRPLAHEIATLVERVGVDSEIVLDGPFVYGVEPGATLAVYAAASTTAFAEDPARAKGALEVQRMEGTLVHARVTQLMPANGPLQVGDLAILRKPGVKVGKATVVLDPRLSPALRTALIAARNEDAFSSFITIAGAGEAADFRIEVLASGAPALIDSMGFARNTFCLPGYGCALRDIDALAREIIQTVWNHGYQKSLLARRGEGGGALLDEHTLEIRLKARAQQDPPCAGVELEPELQEGVQIVPLCRRTNAKGYTGFRYQVEVTIARDTPNDIQLFVGGAALFDDGSIVPLYQAQAVALKAGETVTLTPGLRSGLPLHALDRIKLFGTQTKVDWRGVTSRGGGADEETRKLWTASSLMMRVDPNGAFARPVSGEAVPRPREYTIANFDIRPYLPDDPSTKLYRVLNTANDLAVRARGLPAVGANGATIAADGVGYQKHSWAGATDADNLRTGIDCSRAIWYAFTRSNLPYTAEETNPQTFERQYLATGSMVGAQSRMSKYFRSCDGDALKTGDVLVYRDAGRNDGHVVLVIDPQQRVAWGSHGWDGNGNTPDFLPDIGVEYQLIKFKKDWERWDRKTMKQVACWRYDGFEKENTRVTDVAIKRCDPQLRCSY